MHTAPTDSAPARTRGRVIVGLAGWSYPDWRGTFYPQPRERSFSELRYAAEIFECLEINSTFYQLPRARNAERWARAVDDVEGFRFTAKLFRGLTHEKPTSEDLRRLCEEVVEGLRPLRESRRLGAMLAQFPWWFDDTPEHRDRIARLADRLRGVPLVVELRHRSFIDGDALPFLERLGVDFANIDAPRAPDSPPPTCVNTGQVGYYRLHGRNRAAWFDRRATRDQRYDYLYSRSELEPVVASLRRLAARTRVVYVIANNHFRAQAPANALEIERLLTGRWPRVPEVLARSFPELGAEPKGGEP